MSVLRFSLVPIGATRQQFLRHGRWGVKPQPFTARGSCTGVCHLDATIVGRNKIFGAKMTTALAQPVSTTSRTIGASFGTQGPLAV